MNKGRFSTRLGALTGMAIAMGGALSLHAQVFNIPIQNSDFSENFTTDTIGYDTPGNDVPGWSDAGVNAESGVTGTDLGVGGTLPYAFVATGDAGAIQVTGHTIQDGSAYTLSWDAAGVNGETSQSAYLFSVNPDFSGFTVLSSGNSAVTGTMTPFSLNYTAGAADAGKLLGVGFGPGSTVGGFAAYDNFTANFVPVPEPAAWTFAGSLMLAGFAGYRRVRSKARVTA